MKNNDLSHIRQVLLGAEVPVLILSHPSPDGDSIGSTIGVHGILTAAGVEAIPVLPELPSVFNFLTTAVTILQPPADLRGKIALVLDCGDSKRLPPGQSLDGASLVINIDHHLHNDYFGDLNYVDPSAAAVGELVYNLFRDCPQFFSPAAAEALYTALVTDTGGFSYSNTTASALLAAGTLVEWGARPHWVYRHLYENKSQGYYDFLAEALGRIELHCAGKVAVLPLGRELLRRHDIGDWELDEVNEYPRSLAGVEVSIVLKETEEGTKASLRSKGWNVAAVAAAFGGGGHNNAAGATLEMSLDEAKGKLLKYLEQEEGL
jgi:phosphoesterase RecJ-like protein